MRTYTQARTILPVLFTLSDRRVAASLASPGVGIGLCSSLSLADWACLTVSSRDGSVRALTFMEVARMPFALLLAALDKIRDPRRPQGQRYTLAHLLLFSVLAVLAGATSYQKIITFIAVQRDRLNTAFGTGLRRAPAGKTPPRPFPAPPRGALQGPLLPPSDG